MNLNVSLTGDWSSSAESPSSFIVNIKAGVAVCCNSELVIEACDERHLELVTYL